MCKFTCFILALGFAGATFAADIQTIELKDGGKLILKEDKTMVHVTPTGKRSRMKDGKPMQAADGSMVMMKNNAVWKTITEKGTLNPNR